MLRLTKKWLPPLLVLGLLRDCQGRKPVMSPTKPEIYIDEGDSLELTCMSPKTMRFYYPSHISLPIDNLRIKTSPASLDKTSLIDEQKIIFRRSKTVHGDTGWYGCADRAIKVTPGIYNQRDVSWTYVYVTSNTSYFVQSDRFQYLHQVVGETATVPCRPTSPHHKLILIADDPDENKSELIIENTSYDPRFGFHLINITFDQHGNYRCKTQEGNPSERRFKLIVIAKPHVPPEPKIIDGALKNVTLGQTLYLNCTANIEQYDLYTIHWTTPQWDDRITTRLYVEWTGLNKRSITRELTVKIVNQGDAEEYECGIATLSAVKTTEIYIRVNDPEINYIYLKSPTEYCDCMRNYGDHIEFVVEVNAYPQPKLRWLYNSGDKVIDTSTEPENLKYVVRSTLWMTSLTINHLTFDDAGTYSLNATNEDRFANIFFSLTIIRKPTPMFNELSTFYLPNKKVEIACTIEAVPEPNVTWTFSKAPNYRSLEGSEIVKLKNYTMIPNTMVPNSAMYRSMVTVMMETSGHLTCTVCNILGCGSVTNLGVVSDVPGGFGIMTTDEMKKELMEGDDVEMICAAARDYYFKVHWGYNVESAVTETNRISITNSATNYSYRSTLRIKNLLKSDERDYVCLAQRGPRTVNRPYTLRINNPMAALISETNMNKTTIAIDRSTEKLPVVFKCRVRGVPKPNIIWYKDDTRIDANEQYECHDDYQELRIKYLRDENSGRYTCKVQNRFGNDENYQIILIKVKEVSKVWIISIVVLVLICATLVIFFSIKMHRGNAIRKQLMEIGLVHFEEGALQYLDPNLTVGDQAELLPYDKKWEFPRERLTFGKQLGFGTFGVVVKAHALGIYKHEAVSTVAVKMVRKSTGSTCMRALASELKIMVHLGKHLNVVNLLGACTKNINKRELIVIVEYCRFGNLRNYLLRHRADFINQIDSETLKLDFSIGLDLLRRITNVESNNSPIANSSDSNLGAVLVSHTTSTDCQSIAGRRTLSPDGCVLKNSAHYRNQNLTLICTQDLLSWGFQVARGMEYLSQRKVLHGDLAARNILLAENDIVKICDFGLGKTMYKYDHCKKKGDTPLPIKWMAIESIRDQVFSTQSDVWSFGVVLWEFFTLAKNPYPGMKAEKQYQRLIAGYRMEQPAYATKEVYDIILQCWNAKPTLRPTFTYLVSSIGDLMEEGVKEHYLDLNAPYMDMNTAVLQSGKNDYLTMMSTPDYHVLVPNDDYVKSLSVSPAIPQDDSDIPMSPSIRGRGLGSFSSRITSNYDKNNFSTCNGKSNVHLDSEGDSAELSPMLNHDSENDRKLINIQCNKTDDRNSLDRDKS